MLVLLTGMIHELPRQDEFKCLHIHIPGFINITLLLTSHNTTNNKIIPSSVLLHVSATNGHHQENTKITHIYIYTLQNCCTNKTGYSIIKLFKIFKNT
jgi:hypothetical protein